MGAPGKGMIANAEKIFFISFGLYYKLLYVYTEIRSQLKFCTPFLSLCMLPLLLSAQTQLNGLVTDQKGNPIAGANIYIKDSYDGTSSDANGKFILSTQETGDRQLVISYIGFETYEGAVLLDGHSHEFNIMMKEMFNELNAIVITAGSFEASDERRITILRPLDIVTTAGSAGDIYGALQTLPGTQQVGDETGLFVRGGDASETKTFIDGIAVADPYFTGVPDIPARGRFSPFLFKGTFFSTGGYSAQYGDAMSSALVLESQDLPAQSTTSIGLMSVGASVGHSHRWNKSSLGAFVSYINLLPYTTIVKQRVDWTKAPESFNGSMIFRQQISKNGLLKAFISYAPSNIAINYEDVNDTSSGILYNVHNKNLFSNASYKDIIAKNWTFFATMAYSSNQDDIVVDESDSLKSGNTLLQGRVTLSHPAGNLSTVRFGGEWQHATYLDEFHNTYFNGSTQQLVNYSATYAEADLYFSPKIVARLGGRLEYATQIGQLNIAPRTSIAYKTGNRNQVSFAYGQFYQQPDHSFTNGNTPVDYSHADHYILNFQQITDKQTFRVEAYYKNYNHLITTIPDTASIGQGYAQGIDIFWRDKKTIKHADYWISYSFLDTRRQYLDYPVKATPTFAARHTFSLVYKQTIPSWNVTLGATYVFATGRPYVNPNNSPQDFLSERTPNYNNFSINGSWLTALFQNFTVIAVSVNNVLGFDNIYDYQYPADGSEAGRLPVKSPAIRSFFIGVFMSIGEDRGDE